MPSELDAMREGYQWRRNRDQNDLAVLCATIMNASGRYASAVRPGDLIKQKVEAKSDTRTGAEKRAELEWLKKNLGEKP